MLRATNLRSVVRTLFAAVCLVFTCVSLASESAGSLRFRAENVSERNFGQELNLPDQNGTRRSLAEFRGKVVLVFFGFTQCPDVCPTELARLAEVRRGMQAAAQKIQVIFVTLDPDRDGAELLRDYVAAFDASFIALRGNADETATAVREFRVAYQQVPGSAPGRYTIDHSTYVYAIDPMGRLRLRFNPDMSGEQMREDLTALLAGD